MAETHHWAASRPAPGDTAHPLRGWPGRGLEGTRLPTQPSAGGEPLLHSAASAHHSQAPSTPGHMSQAGVSASQHPAPGTAEPAHQAWESQVHSESAQGAICAKPGLPGSQGAHPSAQNGAHTHTQKLRRARTNHTHAHARPRALRQARQRHLGQRSQPCFGHPKWI